MFLVFKFQRENMGLRDCQAWKDENLAMSSTSNEAVKLYDDVINQYVTWTENPQYGGMEGTVKAMLGHDVEFVMGNVLSAGLDLMGTTRTIRLDKTFKKEIDYLKSLSEKGRTTSREKLHCKAILHYAHEQFKPACDTWEEILAEYPNDLLALKFAHDAYFYLGNSIMIRDSVGRVLPHWKPSNPLYGYLQGMFSFGLEEMNMYAMAERYAKEALSKNPTDSWATHAAAHCYEMTGRSKDGIDFMGATENEWSKGAMLACHNYWHWALYYIENGDYESALGLYDQQVGQRVESGAALDIVDAASLLKRLEMEGINVGNRWELVYDICRPHVDEHVTIFNDVHYLMCYLGAQKSKKEDIVKTFMDSVSSYTSDTKTENTDLFRKVGNDLLRAVVAYSEGRFDDTVNLLYPLKNELVTIGGSHAQRDVFNQMLLQACIQSKEKRNINIGHALLNERKVVKENSPLTDRMISKFIAQHNSAAK